MPKQKTSPQQPTFFHRKVPQMPESYYSSGPNPNLRKFVEEHAKPYNPETDDYNVPPFDIPITTTKATAIYNMHTYWSKKPHDAIQQYIRHYTQPGDLVLDPFCGSGGTGSAALLEGRAAIAIDLSPAATFITKNYCTPVDVDELQLTFEELKTKVKPEMDWLYETRCDRCDGRATTAYVIYSQVFECPRCLERVALYDCVEIIKEDSNSKSKLVNVCPYCYEKGILEEISVKSKKYGHIPVYVSYFCNEGCKPVRGERKHNDLDPKKKLFFQKYDLEKIKEIAQKKIPYWFPTTTFMNVADDQKRWGLLWRPYHGDIRTAADFFSKRNTWALSLYLDEIKKTSFSSELKFLFSSVLLNVSKMTGPNWTGPMGNTLYVPSTHREINIMETLENKFSQIIKGWSYLGDNIRDPQISISTQSALDLQEIPTNTIDYIFTDPPYSGTVQFGELNFIWESWLEFNSNWHNQEVIINKSREKDEAIWEEMMSISMKEAFRVLKPGRWMSLCYHDTSEGTWQIVQDIMSEIGFITDRVENTLYIDAIQKAHKQIVADKVSKRDLVINFRKPRQGEIVEELILTGEEDVTTFTQKACGILVEALNAHPGQTSDRLYDELVSRMVRKGTFERHNFDELVRSVAEEANGRWYLLATADQVDAAESKKETSSAVRLEVFMQKYLNAHSDSLGIHYSDLFEQYLPIKDKPRRLLQDWLPEFFFKTPEGTWRPPATDEERQQKAALRSSGALRRIKRFTNALLDGNPPHDRDKPENAATLTDWIRQCRRAGFYDLGRALYEKGGLQFNELNEEAQIQVEEDYQICVRRSESPVKPASKGHQLPLVEE